MQISECVGKPERSSAEINLTQEYNLNIVLNNDNPFKQYCNANAILLNIG